MFADVDDEMEDKEKEDPVDIFSQKPLELSQTPSQ